MKIRLHIFATIPVGIASWRTQSSLATRRSLKRLRLSGLLTSLLILTQIVNAQESPLAEKIRDVSPDKKFAMRISYDAELNNQVIKAENADAEKIFSQTIKAIELVALPGKCVVANLLGDQRLGGEYDYIMLVWSTDSKWCAFYAAAPRIGYTTAYKQSGNEFVLLNEPQELSVEIEGKVNHEYIRPVKWTKPGVLVLEQSATFVRGSGHERPIRFTARFEEKTGKFGVISKKKVPSKE
jgi:hypothetical protein